MSFFPFKHPGISDINLLVIICVGGAVIFTLSVYLSWLLCCRHASRKTIPEAKKAQIDPELRLQPTLARRDDTWQKIPMRSELTEKEAQELVKLNPSFNRHVLVPDPNPRSIPASPLLSSPNFSHFSHTSSSPLLNSNSRDMSLSPTSPTMPTTAHIKRAPPKRLHKKQSIQQNIQRRYDTDNTSIASSTNYSTNPYTQVTTDIGTSMLGEWQGEFKAVPIERALMMNIPNPSLEEVGLRKARHLRVQGLRDKKGTGV